jgi:hypothetical protein
MHPFEIPRLPTMFAGSQILLHWLRSLRGYDIFAQEHADHSTARSIGSFWFTPRMNMFPDRSESKTLKRARSSIETAHRLDTLYVTETTLLTAEEGAKNAK